MRQLLLAAFLVTSMTTAAFAGPKEDALQVVAKWSKAFAESDVDGMVALYAPDALFLGTGSKATVTDSAGVRAYFSNSLPMNRPRGASIDRVDTLMLSKDAVVVTGFDRLTGVRDGAPTIANGRVTFVIAQRGRDWKIVHFHRSALPN